MRVMIAAGQLRDGLQTMLDDGAEKVLLKGFTAAELSDAISQLSNDLPG